MRTETIKIGGGAEQTHHGPQHRARADPVRRHRDVADAGESPTRQRSTQPGHLRGRRSQWTGIEAEPDGRRHLRAQPRPRTSTSSARRPRTFAVPSQNLALCRHGRQHRLPGSRSDPGAQPLHGCGARASGSAPGLGLVVGLAGLRRLRADAVRLQPPRGLHRRGQPGGHPERRRRSSRREWDYGFRSQRIRSLLEKDTKVTPADMSAIQGDTRTFASPRPDPASRRCVQVDLERAHDFTAQAQELLRGWDFTTPAGDSRGRRRGGLLQRGLVQPARPDLQRRAARGPAADGGDQWMLAVAVLLGKPARLVGRQAHAGRHRGAVRDPAQGPRRGAARADQGARQGARRLAVGPAAPPHAEHRCSVATTCPAPVRRLVNRGPHELPGGSAIVNANGWNASKGYAGRLRRRRCAWSSTSPTSTPRRGSTRPASAATRPPTHYNDQADDWVEGRQRPWPFTEKAVARPTATS